MTRPVYVTPAQRIAELVRVHGSYRAAADAKVRELVEALEAIDLRLTECAKNPDISAADAYDDFYRDCVAEAIAPYRTTP